MKQLDGKRSLKEGKIGLKRERLSTNLLNLLPCTLFVYNSVYCLTLSVYIALHIIFANKHAHWSNVAWAACLGQTKIAVYTLALQVG